MAVFQGTRLRTTALPATTPIARRATAPASGHSGARVSPTGLLLAGILATTMLGLVYLTQTLGSSATSSRISDLETQRAVLTTQLQRQATQVLLGTDSVAMEQRAQELGLRKQGEIIVLKAP